MAEPQPLDLLAEQIDVDQVAGALSALIPPQQDAALPVAEAGPDQIASAEVPVEPPPAEPAPVEPAPVETAQVEPDPEQPPPKEPRKINLGRGRILIPKAVLQR